MRIGDSDIGLSGTPLRHSLVRGDESKFISTARLRGREAVSLLLLACPAGQDAPGLPSSSGSPRAKGGAALAAGNGMLLVTGGAGFIGSNLVAGLNEAGRTDIVVNDALGNA